MDFSGERFVPGKTSQRIRDDTEARYRFAQKFVRGKDVLEIACGTGMGTALLRESGARSVIGADVDGTSLVYAQEHFGGEGVTFRKWNLEELDVTEAFDLIVCFETIEHVRAYKRCLHNLWKALRRGGMLLLSTPNRRITSPSLKTVHDAPPSPFHTQEFVPEEMRLLLIEAGFEPASLLLFGQRQQPYFSSRILRFLYKKLFDPGHRTSATFEPIKPGLHPRDFLFLARKSG